MATAPTTFGVPASCRAGDAAHSTSALVTLRTAPPPARYGGAESSQSRPSDQHATAVRGVQLVSRQREVVDVEPGEVDATMRSQLRGIDDTRAP